MQQSDAVKIESPSLPKGGGAIQGMGESLTFAGPDGMASLSLPLPVSAGRGVAPPLSLSYGSASGNGPFGMGWQCGTPHISLRTAKGVPQYAGEDAFLGPEGEVLVPVTDAQGQPARQTREVLLGTPLGQPYEVTRWQPRIISDTSRLEYWQPQNEGQEASFWVQFSPDGQIHLYGRHAHARVANPADARQIACWLIEETVTPTQEHIYYYWQAEDDTGCDEEEYARYPDSSAQRYLVRVGYGNILPSASFMAIEGGIPADDAWLFFVVFDYGERSTSLYEVPPFQASGHWLCRPDCFSRYLYGFEIRTRRLCRQVLAFHRLQVLAGETGTNDAPALVSRQVLDYDLNARVSLLLSARNLAHEKDGTPVTLAPLEFEYQRTTSATAPDWQAMPQLEKMNAFQPYQLVDLYGEGIPGIMYQDAPGAWWYRAPLRDTQATSPDAVTYAEARPLPLIPAQQQGAMLMDFNGDGRPEWVVTNAGVHGYHTLHAEGDWTPFIPLSAFPLEYFHPQAQLTDITGAGLPDLALVGPKAVRFWANNRTGWEKVAQAEPSAHQPLPVPGHDARVFSGFSDMDASGMSHLVEISARGVRYWPNLGHGRFGQPISMSGFTPDDQRFDPARVYLADTDGSGTTDLIYVKQDHLALYINESGNRFAPVQHIALPAGVRFDDTCQLLIADVQGLGTGSAILTVPHSEVQHWRLDLSSDKPWLLCQLNNNMGADTTLLYRSSAQFWLDEKQRASEAGKVAVSHLPFPVHLLWKSVVLDEISGNQLVSCCEYAQGVWDGREREYRGFARVCQTDSDTLSRGTGEAEETPLAPSRTVNWFATGSPAVDAGLAEGYWQGDEQAFSGFTPWFTRYDEDTEQDVEILPDEGQAYWLNRALKGMPLRSEVYGDDDSAMANIPYSVAEYRPQVRLVASGRDDEPVVMGLQVESRSYQYERVASDPVCNQSIVLKRDGYGLVSDSLTVAYPRRSLPATSPYPDRFPPTLFASSYDEQQQMLRLTRERNRYYRLIDDNVWLPGLADVSRQDANEHPAGTVPDKGLTLAWCLTSGAPLLPDGTEGYAGHQRSVYAGKEGQPLYPPLVTCSETAEFDARSLTAYEGTFESGELLNLLTQGGWITAVPPFSDDSQETVWVARHDLMEYAGAEGFFRLLAQRGSPLTGASQLTWDDHFCVPVAHTDAAGLNTQARYDYRFLQPVHITDENSNIAVSTLDALGRITSTRFHGTENGKSQGYTLPENEITPFIPPGTFEEALLLSSGIPVAGLVVYDTQRWMPAVIGTDDALHQAGVITEDRRISRLAWQRGGRDPRALSGTPPAVLIIETDRYDNDKAQQLRQCVILSDGFGRTLQTAQRAEPGMAWVRTDEGALKAGTDGLPLEVTSDFRWTASGRTEYDGKGQPVRTYLPYFLNDWQHVRDDRARQDLYADTHCYDAMGREYQVITAKGELRRTYFTPWFIVSEDENDTRQE
jgi:hypothetical protein